MIAPSITAATEINRVSMASIGRPSQISPPGGLPAQKIFRNPDGTKVARLVLKKGKIHTTQPFCVLPGQTKVQKTCS